MTRLIDNIGPDTVEPVAFDVDGVRPQAPASQVFPIDRVADGSVSSIPGVELATWMMKGRRLREQIFDAAMFLDPIWDILLCLYVEAAQQHKVKITSLPALTGLKETTAGRRARQLVRDGWLERKRDPRDRRRFYLSLSVKSYEFLRRYFEQLIAKGDFPWMQHG